MTPTKLQHKFLLVFGGILLALISIEIAMRLGGGLFKVSQDFTNRAALDKREDYRILCLGESMTALGGRDTYPNQLEKILNEQAGGIRFEVINKGVPSTTTTQIISSLESYLHQYNPQIVVAMIGINDGASFVPVQEEMANPVKHFLNNLRLYKFYKLLKAHMTEKWGELRIRNIKRRIGKLKTAIEDNPSANNYRKLASLYRVLLDWDAERAMLLKALGINPQDYEANAYLGMNYRRRGDYQKAITSLERAIHHSPDSGNIKMQSYALLIECHILLEQYDQAREVQLKAMEDVSDYVRGWGTLGDLYFFQNNCELAKPLYLKQLQINPTDAISFVKLGYCLRKEGKYDTAEKLLKQAVVLNPQSGYLHAELGSVLLERKKFKEAENVLDKSLTLKNESYEGTDMNIYKLLHQCYLNQGKIKEAQEAEETLKAQDQEYNLETYKNYKILQKELAEKNILLVAAQYPMRNVQRLKNMLKDTGHVIIVDNEKSFKEALGKESFDDYFIDRFAGDFGHCTPKGNRLIAGDIAQAILQEIPKTH